MGPLAAFTHTSPSTTVSSGRPSCFPEEWFKLGNKLSLQYE